MEPRWDRWRWRRWCFFLGRLSPSGFEDEEDLRVSVFPFDWSDERRSLPCVVLLRFDRLRGELGEGLSPPEKSGEGGSSGRERRRFNPPVKPECRTGGASIMTSSSRARGREAVKSRSSTGWRLRFLSFERSALSLCFARRKSLSRSMLRLGAGVIACWGSLMSFNTGTGPSP